MFYQKEIQIRLAEADASMEKPDGKSVMDGPYGELSDLEEVPEPLPVMDDNHLAVSQAIKEEAESGNLDEGQVPVFQIDP